MTENKTKTKKQSRHKCEVSDLKKFDIFKDESTKTSGDGIFEHFLFAPVDLLQPGVRTSARVPPVLHPPAVDVVKLLGAGTSRTERTRDPLTIR